MYLVLLCVFAGFAAFFLTAFLLGGLSRMEIEGKVHNALANRKSKSFIAPVILSAADKVGVLFSKIKYNKFIKIINKINADLICLGGQYAKINPHQLLALQFFAAFCGAFFCFVCISADIFAAMFVGFIFFCLPLIKIKEAVKKRKELIVKQLPDTADLLSIMLDAGSDFFGAADKVCDILKGPLSDELKDALAKISLGCDKKTALLEIVEKTGVEQLGFFVRTINMSLDAGVGMADTLKRLAVQLRLERAAAAQKKAQEAPIKMLIPLTLLIFPTIFIVIFGPIAINFIQTGSF